MILPLNVNQPHSHKNIEVSFEFFPPKNNDAHVQLWQTINTLKAVNPAFVSVTYGAGGTTRDTTFDAVARIASETSLSPAAHLTCINSTQHDINALLDSYWQAGVKRIVALRGDPAPGTQYEPHPHGFAYATDLVAGIKKIADFDISVAAFPEKHPQSPSMNFDIEVLKRKFDAGANRALTQYFFEAETFLRFRDKAVKAGIHQPIVPGILPITNFAQIAKFSAQCGTTVPNWMTQLFAGLENDNQTQSLVAATVAYDLCAQLVSEGVNQFHIYTLNRADIPLALCHRLGVKPFTSLAA
jgi:methylenetetrahydrofolate reductase (NADPH)